MGELQGRGPKKFLGLGKPESRNAAPGRRSLGGRRRRRARLPEFDALNGPPGSGRTRENQRLRRCRGARIGDGAADGRLRRVGPCLAGRSRKHQYRGARVAGPWVEFRRLPRSAAPPTRNCLDFGWRGRRLDFGRCGPAVAGMSPKQVALSVGLDQSPIGRISTHGQTDR